MSFLTFTIPVRAKTMSFTKAGLLSLPMLLCSALMMGGGRIPSNPTSSLVGTVLVIFGGGALIDLLFSTSGYQKFENSD